MDYLGFCAKYGGGKMMVLGYTFGTVAGVSIEAVTQATSLSNAATFGYFASVTGFTAAMAAHGAANRYCSEQGYGISRGGRSVKAAQAASYGVVLASALAVQQTGVFYDAEEYAAPASDQTSLQIRGKPQNIQDVVREAGLTLAA